MSWHTMLSYHKWNKTKNYTNIKQVKLATAHLDTPRPWSSQFIYFSFYIIILVMSLLFFDKINIFSFEGICHIYFYCCLCYCRQIRKTMGDLSSHVKNKQDDNLTNFGKILFLSIGVTTNQEERQFYKRVNCIWNGL